MQETKAATTMKNNIEFRVRAETKPGECVCVVGDCDELGGWDPHLSRPLRLDGTNSDGSELWVCSVEVSTTEDIRYRYFIGFVQDAETNGESKHVMVRAWETNLLPRKISAKTLSTLSKDQPTSEDTFGLYNDKKSVDKGWLTGQTEIHFRLHSNPINIWKRKYKDPTYSVRCVAIDLRYRDASMDDDTDEEENNHELTGAAHKSQVLVSILNGKDNIPHEQPPHGSVYKKNDYIIFKVQTYEPEFLGFKFDFYVQHPSSSPGDSHKLVGTSFILPINLKDAIDVKTVPINGMTNFPIGEFTVDYLVTKPISKQLCDMSVSYANHWKYKRQALDVGHRGMGSSHGDPNKCAAVKENTIASLSEAGARGADFVEFDVQLSKDNVPVVYHDFSACLIMRKRNGFEDEYLEIPVKDLNLEQLQAMKMEHASEKGKNPNTSGNEDERLEHLPFPTLRQVFEKLDRHIGFNIEIKYNSRMKSGELECSLITSYYERNIYVDIILEDILKYSGDRRIMLSCFDADVCTMMRLKQNRYPVLMLCQGDTPLYPPYMDARTWNLPISYSFCQSEQLLGVAPFAERLLNHPSLLDKAKELNLIVITWGEDNNSLENIRKLKDMGVDGLIYDKIYELKNTKGNVFHMEYDAKVELCRKMGVLDKDTPPPRTLPRISSENGS